MTQIRKIEIKSITIISNRESLVYEYHHIRGPTPDLFITIWKDVCRSIVVSHLLFIDGVYMKADNWGRNITLLGDNVYSIQRQQMQQATDEEVQECMKAVFELHG